MQIRHATPEDDARLAPLVADFRAELAALHGRPPTSRGPAAKEEVAAWRAAGQPVLLALGDDEELRGFLACRREDGVVWAEALYVVPAARRRGVAKALHEAADALAAEVGQSTLYNWIHPDNDAVVHLLRSRGYDVLNLIEVRRARPQEGASVALRVGHHTFRYPRCAAPSILVRPFEASDHPWASPLLTSRWGATRIVSRGRLHETLELPGFVAEVDGAPVGLATYRIDGPACELVSLDSTRFGVGVGGALVEAVRTAAATAGCERLWLVTTNDNLEALRFHQRRGFRLVAVHRNAVEASRRLKPEIPGHGSNGLPVRDEIELELSIGDDDATVARQGHAG